MPSGKTMLHRSAPGGHRRSRRLRCPTVRAPGSTGMPRPMRPVRASGLRAEAVRRACRGARSPRARRSQVRPWRSSRPRGTTPPGCERRCPGSPASPSARRSGWPSPRRRPQGPRAPCRARSGRWSRPISRPIGSPPRRATAGPRHPRAFLPAADTQGAGRAISHSQPITAAASKPFADIEWPSARRPAATVAAAATNVTTSHHAFARVERVRPLRHPIRPPIATSTPAASHSSTSEATGRTLRQARETIPVAMTAANAPSGNAAAARSSRLMS